MKTPREILLNRHQTAETALNQIRREVVTDLRREKGKARETPLLVAAALKLWRELVLPARVTWGGLAAVWLVIGLFNLSQTDNNSAMAAKASPPTRQELRTAQEQRRELLIELALLPGPEATEPRKPNLQPRSARESESACV